MDAPDKIYLERSLSFPDKFHSRWYKDDVVGNGEEYIRKNALVEWLQQGFDWVKNPVISVQQIIDKLNSM